MRYGDGASCCISMPIASILMRTTVHRALDSTITSYSHYSASFANKITLLLLPLPLPMPQSPKCGSLRICTYSIIHFRFNQCKHTQTHIHSRNRDCKYLRSPSSIIQFFFFVLYTVFTSQCVHFALGM